MPTPRPRRARGFTLVELLVVIAIVALVSAATLPSILSAINHRQIVSAASMLQGALINARDGAVRSNEPQGLRFLVDQALATSRGGTGVLAFSSWEPITFAPEYSEGLVTVLNATSTTTFSGGSVTAVSPVTVAGPLADANGNALPPTSWYWNIRRGDKIRFNGTGLVYTIVGPTGSGPSFIWNAAAQASNPEGFINEGAPGSTPSGPGGTEILFLADGLDNPVPTTAAGAAQITTPYNKIGYDGYIDELFDGVDNNGDGTVDDLNEWEPDALGSTVANLSAYIITRRPMANARARVTTLPADVVIDATTLATTAERSRLPIDTSNSKYFDLIFAPNGQVLPNSPFAGTASQLNYPSTPFYHFWLTERAGVNDPSGTTFPALPLPGGSPPLQGERRLVTLNAKSGMASVKDIDILSASDPNLAYRDAQNGVRDKQ